MEVQNQVSRLQDIVGASLGTVQGATTGAFAGSQINGGAGAVIGGLTGAVASGVAGYYDVKLGEMLRNESLDFTKDLFGYRLGNIQALPQTISKVSAFNKNNKIFPVLEYYTCTNIEKNALKNKLKYNGMTIMTIGTIGDYAVSGITNTGEQYVKGKIIRLPSTLEEEHHLANQLVSEINKGVYI